LMLKLVDLIRLFEIDLGNDFKIHCATGSNPTPLEAFVEGSFQQWQEYQNKQNFQCEKILSLISLGPNKWMFAGVYEVCGVQRKKRGEKVWFEYSTRLLPGLDSLVGRAIVHFEKKFRASYLKGPSYAQKLFLTELREEKLSVGEFPGYNQTLLSYHLLKTVIRKQPPSWKAALENVSGVYLVMDNQNGKTYVGSAYGGEGLWQRWTAYAKNGHGGNRELRDVLSAKGAAYKQHFQFAILEVFDLNAGKDYALKRENHWKTVLRSREFGYNGN